jgi:hypothetical protein
VLSMVVMCALRHRFSESGGYALPDTSGAPSPRSALCQRRPNRASCSATGSGPTARASTRCARALRRPIASAADRAYRHARANPRGGGVLQGLLCQVPAPGCVAIPASMPIRHAPLHFLGSIRRRKPMSPTERDGPRPSNPARCTPRATRPRSSLRCRI